MVLSLLSRSRGTSSEFVSFSFQTLPLLLKEELCVPMCGLCVVAVVEGAHVDSMHVFATF